MANTNERKDRATTRIPVFNIQKKTSSFIKMHFKAIAIFLISFFLFFPYESGIGNLSFARQVARDTLTEQIISALSILDTATEDVQIKARQIEKQIIESEWVQEYEGTADYADSIFAFQDYEGSQIRAEIQQVETIEDIGRALILTGFRERTVRAINTVVVLIILIALVPLLVIQFGKFMPQFLSEQKFFLAVSIICAIQFALIWLTQVVAHALYEYNVGSPMPDGRIDLIISWGPIFTAVVLSSLLFGKRISFILTLFFTFFMFFITQFNIAVSFSIFFVGGFSAYFAQKIRYRRHLLWLIAFMLVSNIIVQLLLNFVTNSLPSQDIFTSLAAPTLSVLFSIGIAYLLLPLFEHLFGITTVTTLLELADLSNPLLKRLAIEAPGTFNHSLAVGNLAELGAEKIGASPILCRVLAYYHDVGKIKNPGFFTENQLGRKNPHDKLTPLRSSKILMSHIKDGCDLVDDYRITKVIRNGIIQHHGTGVTEYFYRKALENQKENEEINVEDFSYPGEKPQTKETAILMLADKVEAMSKSLKGESEADLRKKIHENVRKIVVSGQLDECGLTFRNVTEIVNSFMPALKGIFHERIEYPEEVKNGKD